MNVLIFRVGNLPVFFQDTVMGFPVKDNGVNNVLISLLCFYRIAFPFPLFVSYFRSTFHSLFSLLDVRIVAWIRSSVTSRSALSLDFCVLAIVIPYHIFLPIAVAGFS